MKKNTEEKIYKEAFRLFMTKPYEQVTVKELEEAIGMTRGAIFYYVRDKEQLFREVIDRFYIKSQNLYNKTGTDLDYKMSLKSFIDLFIVSIENSVCEIYISAGLDKKTAKGEELAKTDRSYLSLGLIMDYYLAGFTDKMKDTIQIDKNTWTFFIQQAVVNGEIKPSTNPRLYGDLFTSVYYGTSFQDAFNTGINTGNLKELLMILYNQIKI